MISNVDVDTLFREGDEVVLAKGTYQGTPGVFVRLRKDVNWADITERNGSVRCHPVAWLTHSTGTIRVSVGLTPAEPERT
jgi:hypothetical protein